MKIIEEVLKFMKSECKGCDRENYASCNVNDYVIELLENLAQQEKWISIDQMPEQCGMSLLLVGINGYGQMRVFQGFTGYCELGTLLFHSNTRDVDITKWDITHWMALPEPPKVKRGVR